MNWQKRNHLTIAGCILIFATIGTGLLGVEQLLSGLTAVGLMVVLAMIKGGIIIWDFMEVRSAPIIWRNLTFGWVILISAIIAAGFLIAPTSIG